MFMARWAESRSSELSANDISSVTWPNQTSLLNFLDRYLAGTAFPQQHRRLRLEASTTLHQVQRSVLFPRSGHSVKSRSLEKIIRPICSPRLNHLIVRLQCEIQIVKLAWNQRLALVQSLVILRIRPAASNHVVCNSIAVCPGRETSQTERLAAGLLLETRILMLAVPDKWTGSVSFGVAKQQPVIGPFGLRQSRPAEREIINQR